jgi:hypothetical protein
MALALTTLCTFAHFQMCVLLRTQDAQVPDPPKFGERQDFPLELVRSMTLPSVIDFISTWALLNAFCASTGQDKEVLLKETEDQLSEILDASDSSEIRVRWRSSVVTWTKIEA